MQKITKIGNFTLSVETYHEVDNIWHSWEVHNREGKSVNSNVWNVLNNLKIGQDQIIEWIRVHISEKDFYV